LEKPVPITRDLGVITERVNQYLTLEVHADLTLYTEFATIRRYENSDMVFEKDDIKAAIEVAELVLVWVKSKISIQS
jgi:hypothetical protein